jgi:hypothetical protein
MACDVAMLKTDIVQNLKRKYQGEKIEDSSAVLFCLAYPIICFCVR